MNKNLVSVIITTKNEEKNIERLLKSISLQSYKNIETIVVDNASKDKTVEKAKKWTKLVFNKGPERSAQRNFGAAKAKGKYIVFLDADMELTEDVIISCVRLTESEKNVGGVIIPEISIGKNFWEKVKAFERSFYYDNKDETVEAARFFAKAVFNKVGGYDECITGPEDWDLPETIKKNGWKIRRIDEPLYHYESIPNLKSLLQKKYYYGLKAHTYVSKQQTGIISGKTLYFLRPVFYKYPKKYIMHPFLSFGMAWMLLAELFAGGLGFFVGKIKNI